jgi:hypothetical protein
MTVTIGSAPCQVSRSPLFGSAELDRATMTLDRVQRFLEKALSEPWHAYIVLQLAESVGDKVDSLPGYIDQLLAIISSRRPIAGRGLEDQQARDCDLLPPAHAKYAGWFAQLGQLVLLRFIPDLRRVSFIGRSLNDVRAAAGRSAHGLYAVDARNRLQP